MEETANPMYIVNVEVAFWKGSDWLLIERGSGESHASGLLSLVGGKVEARAPSNDVLEKTARREVLEEIGVTVDGLFHYVGNSLFVLPDGCPVVNVILAAALPAVAKPRSANAEEVASIRWLPAQEIQASADIPVWTKRSIELAEHIRRAIEPPAVS